MGTKVFLDNCPTCQNGVFETAREELDELVALARDRWGEGRMTRINKEYVWVKDSDKHGDWRGCCAEKIAGTPQTLELSTEDGTVIFDRLLAAEGYTMRGLTDRQTGTFRRFNEMRMGEVERGWIALSSWRRSRQRY